MANENDLHPLVAKWFECWNSGNVDELPISENFVHTSPFGRIDSRKTYMDIVNKNKKDFLGNRLEVLTHIQQGNRVCVQFEQNNAQTGLQMDVCEWYQIEGGEIVEIRSFYNIGNAEIKG